MADTTDDPHDLARFVVAQEPVFEQVVAELRAGAKASHWMWFVFPQLKALGRSATARRYGIADAQEARAYWQHAVLGPRLRRCAARRCSASSARLRCRSSGRLTT